MQAQSYVVCWPAAQYPCGFLQWIPEKPRPERVSTNPPNPVNLCHGRKAAWKTFRRKPLKADNGTIVATSN